ncbi:MAG: GAF domain-containing protein, partial [Thermotogaceae bacterium]|nr:GAF domain-containing protein [Thermotogaceae bacterium]
MKAPYWVAGYETDGKLFGKRSRLSYECDGVKYYLFSEEDLDENILKKLNVYARKASLEVLEDEELLPYIAARLNSSLNLKSLLKNIEKYISVVMGAEAVSILFSKGDYLEFFVTEGGASGRIESIPVPMESIAGTIFLNKKTMVFNDLQKEKKHFKGVDRAAKFVTKNIVGSPIYAGDIEIGVIEVLNKEGGFEKKDAKLLELFSNLIGRKIYSSLKLEEFKRL